MKVEKQTLIIYNILKLFFIIDIFFVGYYQNRFPPIGGVAVVLVIIFVFLLFLYKLTTGYTINEMSNSPIMVWFCFSFWAFATSIICAEDIGVALNSLVMFISLIFFMIFMNVVYNVDGNFRFVFGTFALLGCLVAVSIMFWGTYRMEGNIGTYYALSLHSNRNCEAVLMIFGVAGILYLNDFKRVIPSVVSLFGIVIQFMAIMQGGSRKGAIGVVCLIVLWWLFSYRKQFEDYSAMLRFVHIVFWIMVIFVFSKYMLPVLVKSWAFERLFKSSGNASSTERDSIQRIAINLFKTNPIFGIGYDQVRVYGSTYAHSNPIEIVADTGVVGLILYYIPFFMILMKFIRKIKIQKMELRNSIVAKDMLVFIVFIIICIFEVEMVSSQDYMTVIMYGVCAAVACGNVDKSENGVSI